MIVKLNNALTHYLTLIKLKFFYPKNMKINTGVRFRKRFNVTLKPDAKLIIGSNDFFNNDCSINCRHKIVIGENTIFGENVKLYDHNHRFNRCALKTQQGFKTAPIIIGNNCWIGSNVVILKGVKIGDNSVIGAGVVLRHSVAPNTVVSTEQHMSISQIRFKE